MSIVKDLAPSIVRQRLLIEALYRRPNISQENVEQFLIELPAKLNLRIYSPPVVYSPGGQGKQENQGYDGFVALIDSGISIYVWENKKFLSVVVYTCKQFDVEAALQLTRDYFTVTHLEHMSF